MSEESRFSRRTQGVTGSAIRELFKLTAKPGVISFGGGNPSPAALPDDIVADISRELVATNGKVLKYRLVEKTPSNGSKVPLLFFFHGAGQRGDDNTAQLGNLPDIVTWLDANEAGFKVVAGQVPSGKLWVDVNWNSLAHTMLPEPSESMGLALELLDTFLEDPAVDTNRVYATGLSMGGYGTWDAISRRPDVFAAAIPICGGADVAQAHCGTQEPTRTTGNIPTRRMTSGRAPTGTVMSSSGSSRRPRQRRPAAAAAIRLCLVQRKTISATSVLIASPLRSRLSPLAR